MSPPDVATVAVSVITVPSAVGVPLTRSGTVTTSVKLPDEVFVANPRLEFWTQLINPEPTVYVQVHVPFGGVIETNVVPAGRVCENVSAAVAAFVVLRFLMLWV